MKKLVLFLIVLLVTSSMVSAQTYVAPGDGSLWQAIDDAGDGDVLQLVPGALYTESTNFRLGEIIDKSIIIEVEGDGSEKAVVQILTAPTNDNNTVFFYLGDNGSLTLRGIEFNGSLNEQPTVEYLIQPYMGEFPAAITINKIKVENCYIHNLNSDILAAGNSDMKYNVVIDSTILDDVVTFNTATSVYYKYCGANYISITNSTFNTISSYGMRIAGPVETGLPDNTPTVIIDHTTWYNIGTTDAREIIQCEKGPHLNPWTVSNSIFAKQGNKDKTVINIKDTTGDSLATIFNVALWDIGAINFRDHSVTDTTTTVDPLFLDADNGDFTLPAGHPLLTFGSDGGPIGDPRWATNATAVEDAGSMPADFSMEQNYPNPFNPETNISFRLDKTSHAVLTVYDVRGRKVAVLFDGRLQAGSHSVTFDASTLESGVYVYSLKSESRRLTKKMLLLK